VRIQAKHNNIEEEEEKKLQRKETVDESAQASEQTEKYIGALAGGTPLDSGQQNFFGSRMGYDFSGVRIHSDDSANTSAKNVNALAYTHGNDIVFGSGQYQPSTDEGKKLLAHELTHVVQQSTDTGSLVQREPVLTLGEPVITSFLGTKVNASENIARLKEIISNLERVLIVTGNQLVVYDAADNKIKGNYTIANVVLPSFYYIALPDGTFAVAALTETSENKGGTETSNKQYTFYGKKNEPENDNDKQFIATMDEQLTISKWFTNDKDKEAFYKDIDGKVMAIAVTPLDQLSAASAGGPDSETPPKLPWMPAWEKDMNTLIANTRKADAVSTDIPEVFKFYYSRTKVRWRAVASLMYEKKKLEVYLDINEKDDKKQKLALIRDKLKIKQLSPDVLDPTSKDAKELDEELTWAYRLKLELDKKISEERVQNKVEKTAYLPDKTSIVTSDDQPGQPFLKLSVYVVESLPENTPTTEAKATSVLKMGVLPQPLSKDTNVDQLFEVVKKATLAIRGQFSKAVTSDPQHAEKTLEPFPSSISVIGGRDDFKTVTSASLDVHMSLNMSAIVGSNTLTQVGIAYKGIYYTWDIYRINDIVTEEEKKDLDADWKKRREQLIKLLKNSVRMKEVNPLINKEKLEQQNKLAGNYNLPQIDAGKTLKPEDLTTLRNAGISYGVGTKLDPDATLAFPPDADDYVIYCRAVTEPDGTTFRLPSEAFYPIKVLDGYKLAEESRDANLEEINDLNKQLAATDDAKKKKEISDRIAEIKDKEQQPLNKRTASDVETVERTKKLATQLQSIYTKNLYQKSNIAIEISKLNLSETESTEMYQLYFTIETTNPGESQLSKVQKLIDQLTNQLKGLKAIQSNISDFSGEMSHYAEASYTPVTALVSKVTGEVYNLITMVGVKTTSSGGTEVILVDVTSHQTQEKYFGSSDKAKDAGGLKEAIKDAYEKFGKNCKYGEGFIAYRIPGTDISERAESAPGFKQRVLEALGYIAMAAGIAALILGTIATGGALGVAAFALGIGAGIIGAGLAIHNIYDRAVNHRLEADVELAMDILNIIGPILQGISAISKVAKLGQVAKIGQAIKAGTAVEESAETIASIAKIHRLVQLEKAFAIIQKGEAVTNLSLLGYKTFKDLAAIQEAYKDDPKKRTAMEWEVLKNAALAGTLAVVALRNEFKPTSAHMNAMEEMVNAGYKEKNYLEVMKKSGLYDAEGKWVDPAIKSTDESISAKEKADAEAAAKQTQQPDAKSTKVDEGKPNEPAGKTEDTGTNQEKPTVKQEEPSTKVDETKTKPSDTGAPPDTGTPAKPEGEGKSIPEEAANKQAEPAKTKKPKEKIEPLVIDKPVTQEDGSVATLKADGSVEIVSKIGKGTGRKGFEKRLLSGIKVGLKGWHRAHSQGQGTGSESPHGIFYAPPEVNLAYQNSGIEARIREIFRITPPEYELTLTTVTKPHPGAEGKPSQRLASIEYKIEISKPGEPRKYLVLEADIKVQDVIDKPKVEVSAQSFGADALWSIRFGDGTQLGMSAAKFERLKQQASEYEKQLTELIDRLTLKLKSSKGDQKKIDQFHLDRFNELRDSLYEHPDMIPTIKAEMEEAALWYPKEPLISADAQSYLNQWRGKINQGSKQHIGRLLELAGSWKDLVTKLQQDPKANETTLKILKIYRNNIVNRLKKTYNADIRPDASDNPESDVDLNTKGPEAGANLIKAEEEMKREFGDNWSKLLRLNFYTEGDRLLRYQSAKMSPEAVKSFEARLTRETFKYTLAKMLNSAKDTPEATERVNKLIDLVAPNDAGEIKTTAGDAAKLGPEGMLKMRDQLHADVDNAQKELSQMSPDDPKYAEKAMEVSLKQMKINFYSTEAYIGPGALMKSGEIGNNAFLKIQKVMSNLEMMEHIMHDSGGNLVKAMKEYEMYKYMYRVSDAINASQMDLFYDYLTRQISKINRQGAESFTGAQLNGLYNDFMNMVNNYLAQEVKNINSP
jgi:hypothetical protein